MTESINKHRLEINWLEKEFHDKWLDFNENDEMLRYILDPDSHKNNGCFVVPEHDKQVVLTMMQWLGTPVGQGFLSDVLGVELKAFRGYDENNRVNS